MSSTTLNTLHLRSDFRYLTIHKEFQKLIMSIMNRFDGMLSASGSNWSDLLAGMFFSSFLSLCQNVLPNWTEMVLQCTHSSKSCVGIFSTSYVFRTYKISYTENSLKSLITVTCKNCIFSSSDQHITQFFTSTHVLLVFTQAANEVIRSVKD